MFLEAQEMMGQGSRVPFAKCVERQEDDRLSELQCRCSELGGARGALRRTLKTLSAMDSLAGWALPCCFWRARD